MDPDPMQFLNEDDETKETKNVAAAQRSRNQLNTLVAISVALIATFMGICKVKDDNIVQAFAPGDDRFDSEALALHFGNGADDLRDCHGLSRSLQLENSSGPSYKIVILIGRKNPKKG